MTDEQDPVAWLRAQVEGDLGIARHILDKRGAWPEPRREMHDAIADREAKLAILDEHGPYELSTDDLYCSVCGDVPQVRYPCRTVRLILGAYRHREGFDERWVA